MPSWLIRIAVIHSTVFHAFMVHFGIAMFYSTVIHTLVAHFASMHHLIVIIIHVAAVFIKMLNGMRYLSRIKYQ
jgi:hypothetical protein